MTNPINEPLSGVPESWIKDRYALAQVTLYILAVVICIQAGVQLISAFSGWAVIPPGTANPVAYRVGTYVIPGIQNLLITVGAITLASQFNTCTPLVWRIAVVVLAAEALFNMLALWVQFSLFAALMLVLSGSGLASLLHSGSRR